MKNLTENQEEKMKKVSLLLVVLLVLVIALASCTTNTASESSAPASSEAAVASTEAAPSESAAAPAESGLPGTYVSTIAKPEGGFKIGVSNNIIGNSWRAQWIDGINAAAEDCKAKGLIGDLELVSSNADLTTQLNQINSLVQDGCNAILIDPVSDTGCAQAIQDAIKAGVLVFIVNDPAAYEGTTALVDDTVGVWQPEVQYFFEQFPEEGGTYMYLSGLPGLTTDTQRTQVVTDVNAKYPNVKQVMTAPGKYSSSEIQSAVLNLLSAYPDFDGMLTQESEGDATVAAFKTAGVPFPKYMSGDSSVSFYRTWQNEFPEINCCGTAFPPSSGYNAVQIVARILNGKTFKADALKSNPMDANMVNAILFEPPYVVTKDGATGQEDWAQVPGVDYSKTQYISLDDAVKLAEGLPDTSILDRYLTDEEIDSYLN
jgi:ribose transport system substrate-binding protein